MNVTGTLARKSEWNGKGLNIDNEMRSEDNSLGKVWLKRGAESNTEG